MNSLQNLLAPIREDSFCGEDGSYDGDFETARSEADKISGNDFALMGECSHRFLARTSKDMRVLGFLTLALAVTEGLDAFAQAIGVYCRLVMEHWEDIHPRRLQARANALKWLNGDRLLALLGSAGPQGDAGTLSLAWESLEKLQSFCEAEFPDGAPSFAGLSKAVREMAEKNLARDIPSAPQEAAPRKPSTAVDGGASVKIASMEDTSIAIQSAASYLLEANRAAPLPYRLLRILKWEPLQSMLSCEGGRIPVQAPHPSAREAFRNLFQTRQWPELIHHGEDGFSADGMSLWLDLQRFLCAALQGLGGEYSACARAIMVELALLVRKIPALPTLAFADGTPCADPMTQEWIRNEVKACLNGNGNGGENDASISAMKPGELEEERERAEGLLAEGRLEGALRVLRAGSARDSSEKNNFGRQLIMADLCHRGGRSDIARAILEELERMVAHHDLARWEPVLCATLSRLAGKVYLSLADAAEDGDKVALRGLAAASHASLSRLDPVMALNPISAQLN